MYRPNANDEVKGVIVDGAAWAGIRTLTPNVTPFEWNDLSDNTDYPDGACGIAVSNHNNQTHVEIVAPDPVIPGATTVWETDCTVVNANPSTLTCTAAWTAVNPLIDSPPLQRKSAPKMPPAKKPAANHRIDKGNKHRP
ncbi:hypothetical protein M8Z33_12535 [Streptomyces sp. ZAF1911]|uniref:hypothetical protein n=1 Tax=Streptomyces sp. ZAF1911 TaxID=2944129 RepID=UPI00237C222B|nr:hypothetical protein [Streptomyces sp. ZAF1911]MDD9377469.1 hypothetical protein [Streptomyces sp. ZAF1911]